MKGHKLLVLALAGISFFTTTQAFADLSLPAGWFAELNVGGSKVSNVNYGAGLSSTSSGLGYNLDGGFKFMPYFAGEIGITKYANTTVKYNGTGVAKDSHWSWDIAGRAILPVSDSGFELFAKLGLARAHGHVVATNQGFIAANGIGVNTGTHAATGAFLGFGGDYNFYPNTAVNVQWQRAKGNRTTGNLDLYSIGLTYIFN